MRTALILLAVVLALPAVAAQLPSTNACGPIAITAPPTPSPVAPGASVDLPVVVENTGQIATTVTVTASAAGDGWTLGSAPAPASVASGATGSFTFRITPSEGAAERVDVTFSASGACNEQLPVCPAPNACQAGPVVAGVQVPLASEGGFSIPFLQNMDIPLELLVAAIVLIGLASAIPFLMRRQKGRIVAQCPEPLKMVKPGRGTSFPIELKNGTKDAATAQFEVGPVPEGWSAFMPLPEVQLAAREARSLWLMVRSPATATSGDVVDVELRLKDTGGKDNGVVRVRAEVQGSAEG